MVITTIAFDYYDGLTEGVSLSLKDNEPYYFKLLAWDKGQDQRLFFLSEVKKSDFNDIFDTLSKGQEMPKSSTWLAQWKFSNSDDEKMITKKLENFWSNKPSFIALGDSVYDNSLELFEIRKNLAKKVSKALKSKSVDDLSHWLPLMLKY